MKNTEKVNYSIIYLLRLINSRVANPITTPPLITEIKIIYNEKK